MNKKQWEKMRNNSDKKYDKDNVKQKRVTNCRFL